MTNREEPVEIDLRDDLVGFFVFDNAAMGAPYGKQAFDAIYAGLRLSSGTCVFHYGHLSTCENVRTLAQQASVVRLSAPQSPLANLSGSFDFGAFVAAMWTDANANFKKAHDTLVSSSVAGYLGYMTLAGPRDYLKDARHLFTRQLGLPTGFVLEGGSVVAGENKYRLGLDEPIEIDLRDKDERNIEAATKYPLVAEDEDIAHRLLGLTQSELVGNRNESQVMHGKIRRIGEEICENGGDERMRRIAYRVKALGGSMSQLEYAWAGICGWRP